MGSKCHKKCDPVLCEHLNLISEAVGYCRQGERRRRRGRRRKRRKRRRWRRRPQGICVSAFHNKTIKGLIRRL